MQSFKSMKLLKVKQNRDENVIHGKNCNNNQVQVICNTSKWSRIMKGPVLKGPRDIWFLLHWASTWSTNKSATDGTGTRTTYNLLENYCRSIPEHYRQGSYGGMSPIGCFALTRDNNLEWEECSVPTCKQYCSPYPNCDVSQCIDDNDQTGMKYRTRYSKMAQGSLVLN